MTYENILDELNEIENYDFYSISYDELIDLRNKIDELEELAVSLNEIDENDVELAEIFNKIEELRYIIEESETRYEYGVDEDDYYF